MEWDNFLIFLICLSVFSGIFLGWRRTFYSFLIWVLMLVLLFCFGPALEGYFESLHSFSVHGMGGSGDIALKYFFLCVLAVALLSDFLIQCFIHKGQLLKSRAKNYLYGALLGGGRGVLIYMVWGWISLLHGSQ